jgi:hypothetical protein
MASMDPEPPVQSGHEVVDHFVGINAEAAANATAAIAAWISTAREVGREMPEPTRHQALV